ncbi:hypothetical protein, partial [Lactobacillus acidophilus]|uniref:hypothetical protein n=1 Tax=Lactobacillus acidophilus TaxID=1579 RepID=UPI001E5F7118
AVCQSVMSLSSNTIRPLVARGSPHNVPSKVVSRPVRANQRDNLALIDMQAHLMQRLDFAVVGADFVKGQHDFFHLMPHLN